MAEQRLQFIIDAENRADATFREVERGIERMKGKVQGLQPAFRKMALVGTAAFVGIAAGVGLALKSVIEFESSFAGIRKTVEASEEEFAALESTIRKLAKTIPVSTTELNKIGELAGQLGVGVEDIEKFTETIAKIAVTTNLTSEQAATDFARLANIMQIPLDDIDRIGSVVVDLGNNFATTEAEISLFAQRIAGAGKIAGLTVSDTLAIGAAMTSVGVRAEAGGTAVQKVLLEMQKSAILGGEGLEAFANVAGMSADEFSKAFREDAAGAFSAFVSGIAARGDEAVTVFEEIGLEDVRLQRAFLSLAGAGDLLERTLTRGTTAWEENNALTIEAEKRFATTASQIKILKNNIIDVGITLGEVFLPMLNKIIDVVVPIINRIGEWIKENPKLTGVLIIVAAAIAGVVAVIGILGLLLPVLITGFALLLGPIGLVILAIGALIAIGILIVMNWEKISDFLVLTWEGIKIKTQEIFNSIKDFFKQWWPLLLLVFTGPIGLLVTKIIIANWDKIKNVTIAIWTGIKDFFSSFWRDTIKIFEDAIDFILKVFEPLLSVISTVVDFLGGVGSRVGGAIGGALGDVNETLRKFLTTQGSGQFGIDSVPRTGNFLLHKGERVIPAGGMAGGAITINITGNTFLSEDVAEEIGNMMVEKLQRTRRI